MAAASNPLRLASPDDYDDWITYIRLQAMEEDIWQYIDPDQAATLVEPPFPDPRNFYRLENHQPRPA